MGNCNAVEVLGIIGTIFGILGVLAALYFGVRSGKADRKKEDRNDGHNFGVVQSDLGYIKSGVDDLKTEVRELRGSQYSLRERLSKVEESAKQAHKRIDEMKSKD